MESPFTCELCGTDTDQLAACPCELGPECPLRTLRRRRHIGPAGICRACFRVVAHNAIDRRRDRSVTAVA